MRHCRKKSFHVPLLTASITSILFSVIAAFLTQHAVAAEEPLDKVRVQLKWKHQFQFAGYYAAIEKGYFQEAGLEVELLEATPQVNAADLLIEGQVSFAVMSPAVIIEHQEGKPLVLLASILQHSANAIMSLKDSGITRPEDLRGKKIMFQNFSDGESLAMLSASNVPMESFHLVEHSWNLDDLIKGNVAAQTIYLTNEPYLIEKKGYHFSLLKPVDYGIDFYGDCLVTTQKEIRDHPDRTESFLKAVQKGWLYALAHPGEIAQLIRDKYSQEKTLEHLLFEAKTLRDLIQPSLVEIGYTNPKRWAFIADTYIHQGLMQPDYDLNTFLYPLIQENLSSEDSRFLSLLLKVLSGVLLIGVLIGFLLLLFNMRLKKEVARQTKELTLSEQKFRSFFELADIGVAQVDTLSGRFLEVNKRYCEITGYTDSELQCLTPRDITVAEDFDLGRQERKEFISGKRRKFSLEKRYRRKDGNVVWVALSVSALWPEGEKATTSLVAAQDITQRKKTEEELIFASKVFEHSIEGIVVTDKDGRIRQVNQAFTKITGYSPREAIGQNPRILRSDRYSKTFYKEMWQQLLDKGEWSGEIWNRRKNGEVYPEWLTINAVKDAQGQVTNYVSIFHDITELKRQQEALEHQAQHDALTGLPNRLLLNDRLQMALLRRERTGKRIAVLFLDVDNFKHINDGFGHNVGDQLLQELSQRLKEQIRVNDTLARQGGDEFLLLMAEIDNEQDASLLAMRLLKSLEAPFYHRGVEYVVTASIGISIAPDDGNTPETLIKNADIALYRAKKAGRNNFQHFTQELDSRALQRISMEAMMRKALELGEFELHYQPQVHYGNRQIIGAEGLIRWRHDDQLISPAEFIPLAEESGLILPLGAWVIETASKQAKEWQDKGYILDISVNLSSRQFVGQELTNLLQKIIRTTGLQSGGLHFEITESILMENFSTAQQILKELRRLGAKFYLDDFGTGYSSLSYLKRLPLDGLKIDRSFIRDLASDPDSQAIARAIVSLAQTLNLSIVAEGVETIEQLALLTSMSEQILIQGYIFSKPIPAEQFVTLLEQADPFLPPAQ